MNSQCRSEPFFLTSGDCPLCGRWAGEQTVFCMPCRIEAREVEQLWKAVA